MATLSDNLSRHQAKIHHDSGASKGLAFTRQYNSMIEKIKPGHSILLIVAVVFGSLLGSASSVFVFANGAPPWIFAIGMLASLTNVVTCIGEANTRCVFNVFVLSVAVNLFLLAFFVAG